MWGLQETIIRIPIKQPGFQGEGRNKEIERERERKREAERERETEREREMEIESDVVDATTQRCGEKKSTNYPMMSSKGQQKNSMIPNRASPVKTAQKTWHLPHLGHQSGWRTADFGDFCRSVDHRSKGTIASGALVHVTIIRLRTYLPTMGPQNLHF